MKKLILVLSITLIFNSLSFAGILYYPVDHEGETIKSGMNFIKKTAMLPAGYLNVFDDSSEYAEVQVAALEFFPIAFPLCILVAVAGTAIGLTVVLLDTKDGETIEISYTAEEMEDMGYTTNDIEKIKSDQEFRKEFLKDIGVFSGEDE